MPDEENPTTIPDLSAAQQAARDLLELHEQATSNGYSKTNYPEDQINELAQRLHDAYGFTHKASRHNRAQTMCLARAAIADASPSTSTIWGIEVLQTDWTSSYVGHWAINTVITGPTSDNEDEIRTRAELLEKEGHTVRVVEVTTIRIPGTATGSEARRPGDKIETENVE